MAHPSQPDYQLPHLRGPATSTPTSPTTSASTARPSGAPWTHSTSPGCSSATPTSTPAQQAIEVTRLAGLMTVAYLHLHAAHPTLPFGGYYALGVCQDGVSAIERKLTGNVTLFPNTADAALLQRPPRRRDQRPHRRHPQGSRRRSPRPRTHLRLAPHSPRPRSRDRLQRRHHPRPRRRPQPHLRRMAQWKPRPLSQPRLLRSPRHRHAHRRCTSFCANSAPPDATKFVHLPSNFSGGFTQWQPRRQPRNPQQRSHRPKRQQPRSPQQRSLRPKKPRPRRRQARSLPPRSPPASTVPSVGKQVQDRDARDASRQAEERWQRQESNQPKAGHRHRFI